MNKLYKIVTCLIALFILAVVSFAQSVAYEYNFKSKEWTPIASYKIKTFEGVALIKSFDVSALIGVQSRSNATTAGLMFSKSFYMSKDIDFVVGFTGRVVQSGVPKFGGVVFGVAWRL